MGVEGHVADLPFDTRLRFLAEEMAALGELIARDGVDLSDPTPAYGWRAIDALTHLAFLDRLFLLALRDPDGFAAGVAAFQNAVRSLGQAARDTKTLFRAMADHARSALGGPGPDALAGLWADGGRALIAAVATVPPDRKITWLGQSMTIARLVSARHMESWAYGQDIFDGLGAWRDEGDRIIQVADFCVRTFRFSFVNRGLAAPPRPTVRLTAPSGAIWEWRGDSADRVEGSAVDFALVATQRRHVEDTALCVEGEVAARWMRISQCIGGPVLDGPAPGERRRVETPAKAGDRPAGRG
jgi:uncharacterized protein (TIGR03084 family)